MRKIKLLIPEVMPQANYTDLYTEDQSAVRGTPHSQERLRHDPQQATQARLEPIVFEMCFKPHSSHLHILCKPHGTPFPTSFRLTPAPLPRLVHCSDDLGLSELSRPDYIILDCASTASSDTAVKAH